MNKEFIDLLTELEVVGFYDRIGTTQDHLLSARLSKNIIAEGMAISEMEILLNNIQQNLGVLIEKFNLKK